MASQQGRWNSMNTALTLLSSASLLGCVQMDQGSSSLSALAPVLDEKGCLSTTASIVALSDTQIQVTGNGRVGGSVVLLGKSTLSLTGNARIGDRVYGPSSAQVSTTGQASAGDFKVLDLTANEGAVLDFIQQLSQKDADTTIQDITSSQTIAAQPGLSVLHVNGDIALSGRNTLRFTGGRDDRFIVIVDGNLSVAGNANIETSGELGAGSVLFILSRDEASIQVSGNGEIHGTFFAPRGTAQISGKGKIHGAFFAWDSIRITGNGLELQAEPFCPARWVAPAPQPSPSESAEADDHGEQGEDDDHDEHGNSGHTGCPGSHPSVSPSPSPTASASATPSATPSPAPSSSPSASPSNWPSPDPSPSSTGGTTECVGLSCGVLGV